MPGARVMLEALIARKRQDGEHELADKLEPVKDSLAYSSRPDLPLEVYAIYAAHYAGEKVTVLYATAPRCAKPH